MIKINDGCINCDMCGRMPHEAIAMGDDIYEINQDKCVECEGYYDTPNCYAVCPVEAVDIL